jgi:hypothetical protein
VTTIEVSQLLGVTPQAVTYGCRRGRFAGAHRSGRDWNIPYAAVRPLLEQGDRREWSGHRSGQRADDRADQ